MVSAFKVLHLLPNERGGKRENDWGEKVLDYVGCVPRQHEVWMVSVVESAGLCAGLSISLFATWKPLYGEIHVNIYVYFL